MNTLSKFLAIVVGTDISSCIQFAVKLSRTHTKPFYHNCGHLTSSKLSQHNLSWHHSGYQQETLAKNMHSNRHIEKQPLPGTIIISDCWKVYGGLHSEDFEHLTVNHSVNFVDPATGAYTQNIEHSWRDLKKNVPHFGKKKEHYDGFLAEY